MQRRRLLGGALTGVPLTTLMLAGLLPIPARAAWPGQAFHAESLDDAIAQLLADQPSEDTDRITMTAPDIAENGRVVPVEVSTDLPNLKTLTLLSDGNPFPLLARAHFTPKVAPRLSIRVKLGQSANLIALVEADGKLYRSTRAVQVTAGGCSS
jgi:sulfur-oxidizing protein SoxY